MSVSSSATQVLQGVASRGLQLMGARLLFTPSHRRLLRCLGALVLSLTVGVPLWLHRAFPSEPELAWCYAGGVLNGALLLPLVLILLLGERAFRA